MCTWVQRCAQRDPCTVFEKRGNLKRPQGLRVIVSTGSGDPEFANYPVPRDMLRHIVSNVYK